jgi:hypothetical protein
MEPGATCSRDHRSPFDASLVHRTADDRFDLGTVALVNESSPRAALDLATGSRSPRKRLHQITLQLSGIWKRALAKWLPHPIHERGDERARTYASGATVVDFMEASSFGTLLGRVPQELRSSLRTDLIAALDARQGPEGISVRGWSTLSIATRS